MKISGIIIVLLVLSAILLFKILTPKNQNTLSRSEREAHKTEEVAIAPSSIDTPISRTIQVQVLWSDTKAPAAGTSVTLTCNLAPVSSKTQTLAFPTAVVDGKGTASFAIPEAALSLFIKAERAEAASAGSTVTLPCKPKQKIYLRRLYRLHGFAYTRDNATTTPAVGTVVSIPEQENLKTITDETGRYDFVTSSPRVHLRGRYEQLSSSRKEELRVSIATLIAPLERHGDVPHSLEHGKLNGPYNLILEQGRPLLVSVFEKETLNPIEGALVTVKGMLSKKPYLTDSEGMSTLKGLAIRMHQVGVKAEGYAIESALVDMNSEKANTVMFTLKKAGIINVLTVDKEQRPLPGMEVKLSSFRTRQEYDILTTDASGRVSFRHAPLQEILLLQASHVSGLFAYAKFTFKDDTKVIEKKLTCSIYKKKEGEYWLKGRVVDPVGIPIPDVTVYFYDGMDYRAQVLTNEYGEFEMKSIIAERGMVGLSKKGYQSVYKNKTESNKEIELVMQPSVDIEGKVEDYLTRDQIQSFSYKISGGGINDSRRFTAMRIFSVDGTFDLTDVYPEAEHTVEIHASGYAPLRRMINPAEFTDGKQLLFLLQKGQDVSGKIVEKGTNDPVANARVAFQKGAGSDAYFRGWQIAEQSQEAYEAYTQTDAEGSFSLDGTAAGGTLLIFAEGYAQKSHLFQSNDKFPVTIEMDKENSLSIEIKPHIGKIIWIYSRGNLFNGEQTIHYKGKHNKKKPNVTEFKNLQSGLLTAEIVYGNIGVNWREGDHDKVRLKRAYRGDYYYYRFLKGNPSAGEFPIAGTVLTKAFNVEQGKSNKYEISTDSSLTGSVFKDGEPTLAILVFQATEGETMSEIVTGTNREGNYAIPSLRRGDYTVTIWPKFGENEYGHPEYAEPQTYRLYIDGQTEKDFRVQLVIANKVTGYINLPENTIAFPFFARDHLSLQISKLDAPMDGNYLRGSKIDSDRKFSIEGVFQGKYKVWLRCYCQPIEIHYELDSILDLDNRETDQDVGTIEGSSPGRGSLRVIVTNREQLAIAAMPPSLLIERQQGSFLRLYKRMPANGICDIENLPPGEYSISLNAYVVSKLGRVLLAQKNISVADSSFREITLTPDLSFAE